jgi:hypothetical protein
MKRMMMNNGCPKKETFKRRLKRRFDRPSSGLFSFPKDKYEALQEVQRILGFTDEELRMVFALLEKANGAYLNFEIGDIGVEFDTLGAEASNEIRLVVKIEGKEGIYSAEYKFNHALRNFGQVAKETLNHT